MKKRLSVALAMGLLCLGAVAQGGDPVSVLNSDAPYEAKEEACRQLSVTPTQEAVPALAALLGDEKLSHMARYALEPMPYPEAGAALRDALGKTSGRTKVGVISSLAVRKDEQAVPELVKLLGDGDAEVAQAAAVALGDIGNTDACLALERALEQPDIPLANLRALCEGLLRCAERKIEEQQVLGAVGMYDRLLKLANAPQYIRTAALRGAILYREPEERLALLNESLRNEEEERFATALRVATEIEASPDLAKALVGVLPTLSNERKVRVLEVLGGLGSVAAAPEPGAAILACAGEGDSAVRVAALRALARVGYPPSLPEITRMAWSEEGEVGQAARDALSFFPGEEGDAALAALLQHEDARARLAAVEMVRQGGLDKPAPALLKVAEADADEGVRVAAIAALQDSAGMNELPGLLEILLKGRSAAETEAAEKAVASLVERQKRMPAEIVVEKAQYGALPDGPSTNVREAVARLIQSGASGIEATNDHFGDPAPGQVKQLRVEGTVNGTPFSRTVREGETLTVGAASTRPAVTNALLPALDRAEGEARLALLRILGTTGSPRAFEIVRGYADRGEGAMKDTALRTLCAWPTAEALPTVMNLAKAATDPTIKTVALRGAVRMLEQGGDAPDATLAHYTELMALASNADERKAVLGGLARVADARAFELALAQFADESVRAEAIQAAIAIAKSLGGQPREQEGFFTGTDLTGWKGNAPYWRFEDGAIVGSNTEDLGQNEFIWSDVEVGDFYLAVDVQLVPDAANAGVQFRSEKVNELGQARGYQADIGKDVWGRLYHERDRGKLDWTDRADSAVLPEQWNHCEILAVGPAIWIAVNGKLGAACLDVKGERKGLVGLQLHAGPPKTVRYRIGKLVHNPKVELAGLKAEELIAALAVPEK